MTTTTTKTIKNVTKIATVLLTVCLCACASAETWTVLVKPSGSLNVRAKASIGSTSLGHLYFGDTFEGEVRHGSWIYTTDASMEAAYAYIKADYCTTDEVRILEKPVQYKVTKNKTAVRTKPNGKFLGRVKKGEVVTAIAILPDAIFTTDGGCISLDCLEEK